MFGYIRPDKPNMLVKEFTQYNAFYCGICQAIKEGYGQLPRAGVTYDLTFLATVLEALAVKEPEFRMARCVGSPVQPKAMAVPDVWLDYCAALTCLFGREKLRDDVVDGEHVVRGRVGGALLNRSASAAARKYPEAAATLTDGLAECGRLETDPDTWADMPRAFGGMLEQLVVHAFSLGESVATTGEQEAVGAAAAMLGEWIYLIDALDDMDLDLERGLPNPVLGQALPEDGGHELAVRVLEEDPLMAEALSLAYATGTDETEILLPLSTRQQRKLLTGISLGRLEYGMSQIFAMLPYERCGTIIGNIIEGGLPGTRLTVLSGEKLGRL